MFSFDDLVLNEAPLTSRINPIKGGTPNIFLKKYAWVIPQGKIPRLELTLERRYRPTGFTDHLVETSIILFTDPAQHQGGGQKSLEISIEQYAHIILAFRPDLTMAGLRELVMPVSTWQEFSQKTFNLLPQGFEQMESTWKLVYYKGKGPITIDTKYVVKLGTHSFPWNEVYDHTIVAKEHRYNHHGNSANSVEETTTISQVNRLQYVSDEDLFS